MAACCDKCEKLGTCCEGMGQGEPESKTHFRDALYASLAIAAWIGFSALGKAQKGKKSFLDRWIKR